MYIHQSSGIVSSARKKEETQEGAYSRPISFLSHVDVHYYDNHSGIENHKIGRINDMQ